jgi:hypothetical protein
MATTRSFSVMLNQYLPNDLLKEELIKRDYILNTIEKDDNWKGGALIVPFKASGASSIAFGALSSSSDIAQDTYVRGQIATQPEAWGSMIFNHRDLMEHDKLSEQNFLKILPDTVDDFMDYFKNVVSVNLLNGNAFAHLTVAQTSSEADGLFVVDRSDRFVLDQKVSISDGTNTVVGYVAGQASATAGININTQTIFIVTARGGSTPVTSPAAGFAIGTGVYNDGFSPTQGFSSMKQALLAAANTSGGVQGSTQLYGVNKTSAPYLQAINISGAAVTASNIVEKIFNGYTQTRRLGKGRPTDILMSYLNLGYVMQVVEASKGAYNVAAGSKKTSQYGWTEISIGSVTNQELKFVGIQEMDDDIICFVDWRAWKFYSNGFFRKRKSPDGIEYFEVRNTTGYQYIIDVCLFGDLVCLRPSYNGIMYGISIPTQYP